MTEPAPFEPELGQACFGQPPQAFPASASLIAALTEIRDQLDRVQHNIAQGAVDTPFDNSGARFDHDIFSVHAYSWDDSVEQPWNFRWRDLRVSWYKHYRRGTSVNRAMEPAEIATMLGECLAAIDAMGTP